MVPETYFTVSQELQLFLYSIIFGAFIGIIYDIFRALRSVVVHKFIAVFIEDCIFFLIYSILLMCFAVMFSRSTVRFYYAVANLIGFLLYYFTVGSFVFGYFKKSVACLKYILKKCGNKLWNNAQKAKAKFVKSAEIVRIDKKMDSDVLQNGEKLVYNKTGLLSDDIVKRHNKKAHNNCRFKGSEEKSGKVNRKKKG